ncbi:MAG TPA: phospholipase D-like domain-containing protein [bacterium]|nr:phospholipase D-like domain-containing protein [bacterium]HPN29920.1 phospholipase D-like domain-containing protein [bacterium]
MKKIIIVLFIFLCPSVLFAKPWWWAQFSLGDKNNFSNSAYERWHSYFLNQASATDTVYITSFTWGTGQIATIDGINEANSIGLNALISARKLIPDSAPIRMIGDNGGGAGWTNAKNRSLEGIEEVQDATADYMHQKICYVANKGVIISSANHTAGGWRAQHNNSIVLWNSEFPNIMKTIENQLNECYSGTFSDNTSPGDTTYFSPSGDTVEIWIGPDHFNNGTTINHHSLAAQLVKYASGATESIFYTADQFSLGDLSSAIIGNSKVLKIGAADYEDFDTEPTDLRQNHINDHTLRADDNDYDHLHLKLMIFDMEKVYAGSANFTFFASGSNSGNDELSFIIHDFRLARRYVNQWRKVLMPLAAENTGQADQFESVPPDKPTNLTITANSASFDLKWTKPSSNISDFSRYYIFIDSNPILTNKDIGDTVDDDADGMYNEDPLGNIDRFASNSSGAGVENDDDADGSSDEDPYLNPESQIKNINDTQITLTSYNVGDPLASGVDYWFAVIAVDSQGNESLADTAGPYQLQTLTNVSVETNHNIISDTFYSNEPNITVMSLSISIASGDILDTFTVNNIQNMDSLQISALKLWFDTGSVSGSWDASDGLAGELTWKSAKQWFSNSLNLTLPSSGASFILTLSASKLAMTNDSFQAEIPIGGIDSRNLLASPASILKNPNAQTCNNTISAVKITDAPVYKVYKNLDNIEILNFAVYPNPFSDSLVFVSITNKGSAANADFSNVKLYSDNNSNGFDASDVFIGELFWDGDSWDSNSLNFSLMSGANNISVVCKTSSSISTGDSLQFKLDSVKTLYGDSVYPLFFNSNVSVCSNAVYLSQYELQNASHFANTNNVAVFLGTIFEIPTGDSLTSVYFKNESYSLDSSKISAAKLWIDNGDSVLDPNADIFIDTFQYIGSNIYSCSNINATISNSSFIISIDINGNAVLNDTFRLIIQDSGCKTLYGDSFPALPVYGFKTVTITSGIQCEITAPANNIDTNVVYIHLTGTTLSTNTGDTIKIYVNGIFVCDSTIVSQNAAFDTVLYMTDMANTITVIAVSQLSAENSDTKTVVVNFFDTPSIYFVFPVSSGLQYDTNASGDMSISGTLSKARNGDSISVYVNGILNSVLTAASTNWAGTVPVSLESETISVMISDRFNQTDTDFIIITPGFIISGAIDLDGLTNDSGVLVTISSLGYSYSSITNETGEFILKILADDTYSLNFYKPNFTVFDTEIFISGNMNFTTAFRLNAGDFFFDGGINVRDAALLKKYFGQTGTGYDIDGDDKLGEIEKNFIKRNYQK